MGRETGSQGTGIQSRCEMVRKKEGTFRKIMGPILCPLPGAGEGVDLEGKEGGDSSAFPSAVVICVSAG